MPTEDNKPIAYRECHERGDAVNGEKIYELHQMCRCNECRYKHREHQLPPNSATATTKDFSKIEEVSIFLKKWSCADGTKRLETEYFTM
jgi:hypothetical protein